jgi:tyrosine-protein kinase Etk/Wzc
MSVTLPTVEQSEELRELASVRPKKRDFLDILLLILHGWGYVLRFTLVTALASIIGSLLIPKSYIAETIILPPQQNSSVSSALVAQLGPLAALAGKDLGGKNSNELYVAMLKSRTVADRLIKRFDLKSVYGMSQMSDVRERLMLMADIQLRKDGVISVSVEDRDPKRAADLANAFIEELGVMNQSLAISEASRRRLFFEHEMRKTKDELSQAEAALQKTQEESGMIQLDSQAKAIIESVAEARARVAAKEVQVQSMKSFATSENPDLLRAQQELSALREQLQKLEQGKVSRPGDIQVPTGSIPAVGLAYIQKYRDVKYSETLFELMTKEYELARIDEARDAGAVQVIDKAEQPEHKSKPKRTLIVILATFIAFLVSCFLVLIVGMVREWKENPENAVRVEALNDLLRRRPASV